MNMNSRSYYECDSGSRADSKRFHYLAGRYARFALLGAAPFASGRLEGDADSICGDVSADRVACAAVVRWSGSAGIRMAAWSDGAAVAYALVGSFFKRVFPGGVSEYVSAGGWCLRRLDALVLRRGIAGRESEATEARMRQVEGRVELL